MSDFAERIKNLSQQQLALLALDLKERLERRVEPSSEPLAVIGLGCRFPGAGSAEEYWQLLRDGVDAISEVPAKRWNVDEFYDPDPHAPGKMVTRFGGFVSDVVDFDHDFFGISKREADAMDPQQRFVLEAAWQALEDANINPAGLRGSQTGVFVGICNSDFFVRQSSGSISSLDMYVSTGTAHSVASGRLSYFLGLEGPSVSIDTACSSSLVAIHMACQSLRDGECELALAGGVNLILLPEITVSLSQAQMLSPDGRCKAFDESANGFVRAEGCGLIALKRLSDAERDGDRVHAVILGSASNQDGRSHGLTAPNGPSQEAVIAAALTDGNVTADDVTYVEAHGTGTSLGDPIEARALANVFGGRGKDRDPLLVGSAKTNIGHAESAAGVAGLIKLILSAKHGKIPPSLHYNKLNPHIEWDGLPISVADSLRTWDTQSGRRIGSVSSFGFSGSNAHVVVANAEQPSTQTANHDTPEFHILALSAHTDAALRNMCMRYAERVASASDGELSGISHAAAVGRAPLSCRAALSVESPQQLASDLRRLAQGEEPEGAAAGRTDAKSAGQVAFLFPGQGTQYAGMGRQLYRSSQVFRNAIDACAEIARQHTDTPLLSALYPADDGDCSLIDLPEMTQIGIFATEYALAEMWRSWGVAPSLVLGHSIGEFAAACIAGVFSLEDGIKLVSARGRLIGGLPGSGAMAAVFCDEEAVNSALDPYVARLSIAAINGPENIVVSGAEDALNKLLDELADGGIESRLLRVSTAFHSPAIEPVLDKFEAVVRTVEMHPPRVSVISNVTGDIATAEMLQSTEYWRRHLREPVRFMQGIQAAVGAGQRTFIELGSHPVLVPMARSFVRDGGERWVTTLHREQDDHANVLTALQQLFVAGAAIDWSGLYGSRCRPLADLPGYPFQRIRCWPDDKPTGDKGNSGRAGDVNSLAGKRIRSPQIRDLVYECRVTAAAPAYLGDHRVFERIIMPSPAYLELAVDAAKQASPALSSGAVEITGFTVSEALPIPEEEQLVVQTILSEGADSAWRFDVYALRPDKPAADFRKFASGSIRPVRGEIPQERRGPPQAISARLPKSESGEAMYSRLEELGLRFGRTFRSLTTVWRGNGEALGELELAPGLQSYNTQYIHPAYLDSCFHLLGAVVPDDDCSDPYLLIGIERLRFRKAAPARLWAHAEARATGTGEVLVADMSLFADDGTVVAEIDGIQLKRAALREVASADTDGLDDMWYALDWQEQGGARATASVSQAPAPDTVRKCLQADAEALARRHQLADYDAMLEQLDRHAAHFVIAAFIRLGWQPNAGATVSADTLMQSLRVEHRHERLFRRMLKILAEEKILKPDGASYVVQIPLQQSSCAAAIAPSKELIRRCKSELTLLKRCGRKLADALCGDAEPTTVLFPGGKFSAVEALYRDAPYARTCNELLAKAVGICVEANSGNEPLRILEIGAGTGGTTDEVLSRCDPERTRYVFTDLSPVFLQVAKERYADKSFIEYATFDAEVSAAQQGFRNGTFDIVIAANVLHATADLRAVLKNVSDLLAPGGVLIAIEGTRATRWVDLTFGLTGGWWRFSDTDLRPSHALLKSAKWHELLADCGFESVGLLGNSESEPSQEVLFARFRGQSSTEVDEAGRWLIAGEESEFSRSVAAAFRNRGCNATLVSQVEGSGEVDKRIDGVVLATDIDRPAGGGSPENLARERTLAVSQAVATASEMAIPLWFATRGAQLVDTAGRVDASQAAIWGLARVVALENPECWGGIVDGDPGVDTDMAARQLVGEILQRGDEDQIAYRNGRRYVARLERETAPSGAALELRNDSSYLVTGGLGGIGLALGQWLADRGAGHILLLSRRSFPPRADWQDHDGSPEVTDEIAAIQKMEAAGASVEICQGDVSREEFVAKLFEDCRSRGQPIRGVLHCAVAMSKCPVAALDSNVARSMYAAKVAGTAILDAATRNEENDFFVLFSSTTALLGVSGLGHYAAANQFMDVLAQQRRSSGHPATAINWGLWELMRIASDEEKRQFEEVGMNAMQVGTALRCLERAITSGNAQAIVADINWSALKPIYEARRKRPLLADINAAARTDNDDQVPRDSLAGRLAEMSEFKRQELVTDEVGKVVNQVLDKAGPVSPDRGFFDLGLDSLMAVDLKSRLERVFGWELPSTLAFNYPTVDAIAGFLLAEIDQASRPDDDNKAARSASLAERLAELNEFKRHELIMEEVGKVVSEVLGNTGPVSPDRGLFDMGLDSLMAVDLKSRLERIFRRELPSTLAFNYPTVDAIAGFLMEGILPQQESTKSATAVQHEDMSEIELEQQLAKKLQSLDMQ